MQFSAPSFWPVLSSMLGPPTGCPDCKVLLFLVVFPGNWLADTAELGYNVMKGAE
jgi:hypothetical protein